MANILIIDDEKEICESMKMILEYEGYHVDYSTSAIQGLKSVEENQVSCLLLDIQMPDMSGFEVLKKVKDSIPSLSVIIISAHGSVENAIKATRLGAFDFIEKPIDRDKLLISARNAVEQVKLLKICLVPRKKPRLHAAAFRHIGKRLFLFRRFICRQ